MWLYVGTYLVHAYYRACGCIHTTTTVPYIQYSTYICMATPASPTARLYGDNHRCDGKKLLPSTLHGHDIVVRIVRITTSSALPPPGYNPRSSAVGCATPLVKPHHPPRLTRAPLGPWVLGPLGHAVHVDGGQWMPSMMSMLAFFARYR